MSPSEIATMSDERIVELVVSLVGTNDPHTLASDATFAAVCELRRRYGAAYEVPTTPCGHVRHAMSVEIDPDRWRTAWYRRRLTQVALSAMIGKSSAWSNVVGRKGSCSYWSIDAIAAELGEVTDDLLFEVASDRERQRRSLA